MILVPSGIRVWLAVGRTDMRRGMNGLALQVQEALRRDPHAGGGSTPASLARIMLRELGRDKSGSMSAVQPMSAATELLRGNEMTRIYLALTTAI